jgi:hypothetical protein
MDDCFCNEKHTCIVKIRSPNLENNRFWGNAAYISPESSTKRK